MRKSDREIKNFDEVLSLLDECQTIRLAINGDPYPYVVPLSYGWEYKNGKVYVYFHCAKEGKKLDMIEQDGNVCFETDILSGYRSAGNGITADYRSVIAFGRAERIYGEELVHGLELLLRHCKVTGYSAEDCAARDITAVVKITVESITGKRRFR